MIRGAQAFMLRKGREHLPKAYSLRVHILEADALELVATDRTGAEPRYGACAVAGEVFRTPFWRDAVEHEIKALARRMEAADMTTFLDAKANRPAIILSIGALLCEPLDERRKYAGYLRQIADEVGDRDPMRTMSLIEVADIIEHGRIGPQGIA